MSKKKIDITNIEINNIDLNLIKDFIDMYDDCQEKFNEYNELCNSLRNDERIKEHNNEELETTIKNIIIKIINETSSCKDKNKLQTLKEEYEKYNSAQFELKKYNNNIKI